MSSDDPQGFVERQISEIAQSEDIPVAEAAKEFVHRVEHVFNFDDMPKQNHIWVDRGVFMSCEGAAHAHHQVAKRRM